MKTRIKGLKTKNRIINSIIDTFVARSSFLILGHKSPDEDCIAAMVAFALLVKKFNKEAAVYFSKEVHEHFQYLISICSYNSIKILGAQDVALESDTIVLCDTAKPEMIDINTSTRRFLDSSEALRIEIDHHLGADSDYFGDPNYALVTEASSASELVGHILLKLRSKKKTLERFGISDLVSRNLVLAILTGIVGDSKMGLYLKSRREKRYYAVFSAMFNKLLGQKTRKKANFSDMKEVFDEIQRLSRDEHSCYTFLIKKKVFTSAFGYVLLSPAELTELLKTVDLDTIVSVSRAVADRLAEESRKLGLVAYYDPAEVSDLIQFRIRRSHRYKEFDLRKALDILSIHNGGGHEGAIGFRIPKSEIGDFESAVERIIHKLETVLP